MLGAVAIAGFTLGAAGSLHCIGMCGPLSLALPTHHLSETKRFIALFIYQLGRIITYSLLGLLFGLLGTTIAIGGFQQEFSILLGIIILLLAILFQVRKTTLHIKWLNGFYQFIQQLIVELFKKARSPFSFLLLGMANGLLPCGMIYVAIAAAMASVNLTEGVLFMSMFGAGTLPAMLCVSYMGQMIGLPARQVMKKAVPYFVMAMAIVLILRGMNLDIPYISPSIPSEHTTMETVVCKG